MDKKIKKRGKSRYILITIFALGVIFWLFNISKDYFKHLDIFQVKYIQVKGNKFLDTGYLSTIATPFIGLSQFDIDLIDLEQRFVANSRIKNVKFKHLPYKLIIHINERQGVLFVKNNNGEFFPIDEEFIVLDKADWYIEEDLPIINIPFPNDKIAVGQKLEDPRVSYVFDVYRNIVQQDKRLLSDISEFYYKNDDLCFIDIKSGSRIILSESNIEKQIERFLFLRDNQGFKRNSLIDLRFAGQVVVL